MLRGYARLLGAAIWMTMLLVPAQSVALAPPIYHEVAYGPSPAEQMTVYAQNKPGARTVIIVHGGGWRLQKLATEVGSPALSLQRQGFAVFNVNYDQDSPSERAFPLETNDVEAATEWAIAHAATYNADPGNVVMIGGSSGGQLVARAAEQLDVAHPGMVRAVISLSGPMNFQTLVQLALDGTIKVRAYILSIGQALGCTGALSTCSPEYESEWSPALNIPASGCPNWLLFSSEVDLAAQAQNKEMLADLQAAGCNATWTVVPTGHGFGYWTTVAPQVFAFVRAQ